MGQVRPREVGDGLAGAVRHPRADPQRAEDRKIEVSREADGAFAVVDIDAVWRDPDGNESRWKGRVCKVYSKVGGEWKMTMHTGVLEYP